MAQYQHLPIYQRTYELLTKISLYTKNFNKDYKYSLGNKLKEECMDLVLFIYRANSSKENRHANLTKIVERVQVIELMLRLSKDLRLLTVKQFSDLIQITDSVVRQAQGWLKSNTSARTV